MKQKMLVIDILNYIDDNINTKISIDNISNTVFFNKDYIMRLFKKELGITINQYINYKRIYSSIYYLENTNNSILNIALKNGFYSLEYYSEMFKRIIGVSPSIYRRYYKYRDNINIETFYNINKSIITLNHIIKFVNNYKNIILSKNVLQLSIFN